MVCVVTNFQLSFESNPELLWFSYSAPQNCTRKHVLLSQPIRLSSKKKLQLGRPHFPSLQAVCMSLVSFSLVPCGNILFSH